MWNSCITMNLFGEFQGNHFPHRAALGTISEKHFSRLQYRYEYCTPANFVVTCVILRDFSILLLTHSTTCECEKGFLDSASYTLYNLRIWKGLLRFCTLHNLRPANLKRAFSILHLTHSTTCEFKKGFFDSVSHVYSSLTTQIWGHQRARSSLHISTGLYSTTYTLLSLRCSLTGLLASVISC